MAFFIVHPQLSHQVVLEPLGSSAINNKRKKHMSKKLDAAQIAAMFARKSQTPETTEQVYMYLQNLEGTLRLQITKLDGSVIGTEVAADETLSHNLAEALAAVSQFDQSLGLGAVQGLEQAYQLWRVCDDDGQLIEVTPDAEALATVWQQLFPKLGAQLPSEDGAFVEALRGSGQTWEIRPGNARATAQTRADADIAAHLRRKRRNASYSQRNGWGRR